MARAASAPHVSIIGAGIGGLAAAIALARAGVAVSVYEQAGALGWVGQAINLAPNAVRALDGLGLGPAIRRDAWQPSARLSRDGRSGEITSRVPLAATAEARYGAPTLTVHRATLIAALASALPSDALHTGHKLMRLRVRGEEVATTFANGEVVHCDALIAADGIHSGVRQTMFGSDRPHYTGMVAWRATVPAATVAAAHPDIDLSPFTKWWGTTPNEQIVSFLIEGGRTLFLFATLAAPEPVRESWSQTGNPDTLRAGFTHFHPEARALLAHVREAYRTALYDREPLACWTRGPIALLGDACHAMTPFMAQGAAMGIEDAVILARSVVSEPTIGRGLERYARTRQPRATRVQRASHENRFLKTGADADWVYGFDAWNVPLEP